jgi:prolyl oligopeptidase
VLPAWRLLHRFLTERYVPGARESIGLSAVPDGEAWYAFAVRQYTTTEIPASEIHALGLREVARIRRAMDSVITATGFTGGFGDFIQFLRTDPRFYFTDTASLLREYRDIAKRIDPGLIRLFGRLPRMPYGVIAVPAYAERDVTTAYYMPGSPEAGRPGYFYANTYDLKARPKWEMEALTVHEAVPGHHLQIALAQELENVPEFRKHLGFTAFVEGWGLYAESLGSDLGLYTDPYSRFGALTYDMWRAVRLVVDTGLHSMGWSRQQAIEFFAANSSKPLHDITVEVDRYISWPGQALAYKIGQLKILELRDRAKARLKDKFSERAFHNVVLKVGAVPLDMLEREVDRHIR